MYLVFCGGIKGMRYILPEVLMNPIISDSFGFGEESTSLFFILFIFTLSAGTILL